MEVPAGRWCQTAAHEQHTNILFQYSVAQSLCSHVRVPSSHKPPHTILQRQETVPRTTSVCGAEHQNKSEFLYVMLCSCEAAFGSGPRLPLTTSCSRRASSRRATRWRSGGSPHETLLRPDAWGRTWHMDEHELARISAGTTAPQIDFKASSGDGILRAGRRNVV